MVELSRLEKVELRNIWKTEAQDFTPWLAQEENLAVLSEAIGMELELEAQEKNVGRFKADMLCRNLDNSEEDAWVLIENQLERTDHTHLGQLMTYASGLHTATIVWVAKEFSDEHKAALNWLNEITEDKFKFFGLEVELWRIGDSTAAPKFNIISKPNDWSRSVSKAAKQIAEGNLTPKKETYFKYWEGLSQYLEKNSNILRPQKPYPRQWSSFSIGRSGFSLATIGNIRDSYIAVELALIDDNAKSYFHLLTEEKEAIEKELGFKLDWEEMPNKKMSRLRVVKTECNLMNRDNWQEHFAWFKDKLEIFNKVFRQRVGNLDSDEWVEDAA